MDVRRLAAIDMHGAYGTTLRRRVILAEFVLGTTGLGAIGTLILLDDLGGLAVLLGAWLVGVGANYLPLALHAASLSRPGALDAELAGADVPAELRLYGRLQFWVVVPLLFAVLAVAQLGRGRRG